MKTLYQITETREVECSQEIHFLDRSEIGALQMNVANCDTRYVGLIESAVSNLIRKNSHLAGQTVSKSDMEKLIMIRVILDGHNLTPRFAILRNGDDANYARYTLCH